MFLPVAEKTSAHMPGEGISLIAGPEWSDEQRRDACALADSYEGFKAALAPKRDGSDLILAHTGAKTRPEEQDHDRR